MYQHKPEAQASLRFPHFCSPFRLEVLFVFFALVLISCEKPNSRPELLPKTEVPFVPRIEDPDSFELYSTLAGKMARMEELLNAIDRFLDAPNFHDRVCADADEFHQLLAESRGLYPEKLPRPDQPRFDRTVDETIAASKQLLAAIQSDDKRAAREALSQLSKYRQKAHAEFSN